MATSGIRFNDFFFTEPISLSAWTLPKCAGLYCVLVDDPNWAPKSFQPLCFGEFGNNAQTSAILRDCLHTATAKGKTLFVSVLPLPFSTTQQRMALRNELIWAYNPLWQIPAASQASDLPFKLEIEPPAPRRPIGFVTGI